jgi:DNA polymerase III subunit epsilon
LIVSRLKSEGVIGGMFQNLILNRSLAIIDLETTGTDTQTDRIVEVGVVKINPDGQSDARCRRVNPGVPIPAAASAVHGIYDSDVAEQPRFDQIAVGLLVFLKDCDLCGFNLKRFDLKILVAEFDRVGRKLPLEGRALIDPMEIFHDRGRRDLAAAVRFYCGREHGGAHGASADVQATGEVLDAMLARYADLPRLVEQLDVVFRDPRVADIDGKFIRDEGRLLFNFGKHRGRILEEIAVESPDYLEWMLGGSFLKDTKDLVRDSLRLAEVKAGSAT